MLLNLRGAGTYYIKQKTTDNEVDNVIFITHSSETINLKDVFIETLFFLIPKRRVHEKSRCNFEVLEKLDYYQEKNKKLYFSELFKNKKKLKKNKDGAS